MITPLLLDGRALLATDGGADGSPRIWDPSEPLTGHASSVAAVTAFTADGAPAGRRHVRRRGVDLGPLHRPPGRRPPHRPHLLGRSAHRLRARRRTRLAAASFLGEVRILDPGTGEQLGAPLVDGIDSARSITAFRADGRVLATGSVHGIVRVWDPHTGRLTGPPLDTHHGPLAAVTAFDLDGHPHLAGATDTTIVVWCQ